MVYAFLSWVLGQVIYTLCRPSYKGKTPLKINPRKPKETQGNPKIKYFNSKLMCIYMCKGQLTLNLDPYSHTKP